MYIREDVFIIFGANNGSMASISKALIKGELQKFDWGGEEVIKTLKLK